MARVTCFPVFLKNKSFCWLSNIANDLSFRVFPICWMVRKLLSPPPPPSPKLGKKAAEQDFPQHPSPRIGPISNDT